MHKIIVLRGATALALALVTTLLVVGSAFATPAVNSVVLVTRIYDDCPFSTLTTVNNYPSTVSFSDYDATCNGFANLHVWRFSTNGTTPATFANGDGFTYSADLVINGAAEAGLQVRPWWSESDGRFNVRSTDGEIACFGGRMPFYTFTGHYGLRYMPGQTIHLQIIYSPNGLSQASPATVEYRLVYQGMSYSSGPLSFDMGNPAEDPPYGLWGILNDAQVGGHVQVFHGQGTGADATFSNIQFSAPMTVAVDIKPGSCDNPLGLNEMGLVPVAILGSADLDVSLIDVHSIRLAGVSAKGGTIEYVKDATTSACGECMDLPKDHYPDLVLKFMAPNIVAKLIPITESVITLNLSGVLTDGTLIMGSDCVSPRGNFKGAEPDQSIHMPDLHVTSAPNAPVQTLSYGVPADTRTTISVYSVTGRLVRQLVAGVESAGTHTVSWDVSGQPSGLYFYRLETGNTVMTAKGLVLH